MVRESLDLLILEDGRIATEVRSPSSDPLRFFFSDHGMYLDLVYSDAPETPLAEKARKAHFRMTRRGDRYVFGLTTVLNAKTRYSWEVMELSYRDMVKSVFPSDTKLPTRKEVIAKARVRGYEPMDEDSKDMYFMNFRHNGNDKSNWSYDFTNNRIKVIKAPEPPEQKEQQ